MKGYTARFRKVAAQADTPTPMRRIIAALVAGIITLGLSQLLLGWVWEIGWQALWFASIGFAVAAGIAAATMKRGLAVTYGLLAVLWVLMECLAAIIGVVAAGLG